VSFSPDNSNIVSGGMDGTVKVWDASTGGIIWTGSHTDAVSSVNFSPDNSRVVSGGWDARVRVWDWIANIPRWRGTHSDSLIVIRYDFPPWDVQYEYQKLGRVNAVNFSPDNSKVVSGSRDRKVKVWDAVTGALIWTGEHGAAVTTVNFSSDNSKVVSGSGDRKVRVWDAVTGVLIWTGEHTDKISPVNSANFSPDNSKIVSGGAYTVKVWTEEYVWQVGAGE